MWEYIITEFTNIYDIALLILGAWGISYVVYFWISFLLIGIKGLPGCVWTAILFALSKCDIHMLHICLDSVVNARQDLTQRDYGLFVKLLKIFRDILIN